MDCPAIGAVILGPSPLARGKPLCAPRCKTPRGTIPARAGETLELKPLIENRFSKNNHQTKMQDIESAAHDSALDDQQTINVCKLAWRLAKV